MNPDSWNHGNVVSHVYVYCMDPDSWNCRTMGMWYPMHMYIAWIQIHGTAEPWKRGIPCICILHESRFMEPQNYGNVTHLCICLLHESRFMEPQNHGNLVEHVYVCNILIYTYAEPWKHGTVYI